MPPVQEDEKTNMLDLSVLRLFYKLGNFWDHEVDPLFPSRYCVLMIDASSSLHKVIVMVYFSRIISPCRVCVTMVATPKKSWSSWSRSYPAPEILEARVVNKSKIF